MKIIITDLTRFSKGKSIVCIAGVDPKSGTCIRPMPYLEYDKCKELGIQPGGFLEGNFKPTRGAEAPHSEDHEYSKLSFHGPCTGDEFKNVLEKTLAPSISKGFEDKIPYQQRVIPYNTPPRRSIITVKIKPDQLSLEPDAYDPEKTKVHIRDNDGREYSWVPITDLGFFHLVGSGEVGRLKEVKAFISEQEVVYLRVGLGRRYKPNSGSRDGYWIQANGIYTFPRYVQSLREYPKGRKA